MVHVDPLSSDMEGRLKIFVSIGKHVSIPIDHDNAETTTKLNIETTLHHVDPHFGLLRRSKTSRK